MRNGKKTEADNANQQAIAQVDDRCCCVAGVTVESPRLAYAMPGMAANKVTAVHRLGRLPTQGRLESRLSRGGLFLGRGLISFAQEML